MRVLALVLLLLCSALGAAPAHAGAALLALDEVEAMRVINQVRASQRLGPLKLDKKLVKAARKHSVLMAKKGRIAHAFGPRTRFKRRMKRSGYDMRHAAENVSAGYQSVDRVVAGWMKSEGHRKNLLNKDAVHMGIAVARNPNTRYGTYWTFILAHPR